jgi:hypothetical protein
MGYGWAILPFGGNSVAETLFEDIEFLDALTALLCRDPSALRDCASLLSADDFAPNINGVRDGYSRWVVASRALDHWSKHHEPIGRLLRADLIEYGASIGMAAEKASKVRQYGDRLMAMKPVSPAAVVEKVVRFKREILRAGAIQELVEMQSSGQLDDDKWREISRKVLAEQNGKLSGASYNDGIEARMERRRRGSSVCQRPWTLIPPLDSVLRQGLIARGELGLVEAPTGRGKSILLLWLETALAIQRYNCLHVTFENSRALVEDRLDSIVTSVPLASLRDKAGDVESRFRRWRAYVDARIEIMDMRDGGATVPMLDDALEQYRNRGFIADAIILDYDRGMRAIRKYDRDDLRYAEFYHDLIGLLARRNMIGWIASQSKAGKDHMKILSGDTTGGAYSKMQDVSAAIRIGKGTWTDDARYLWVAKNTNGKPDVGAEVVPDLERSLIYSRERTERAERDNA